MPLSALTDEYGDYAIVDRDAEWMLLRDTRILVCAKPCDDRAYLVSYRLPDFTKPIGKLVQTELRNIYGEPNDKTTRGAFCARLSGRAFDDGIRPPVGRCTVEVYDYPKLIDAGIIAGYFAFCYDAFRLVYGFSCEPTGERVTDLIPIVEIKVTVKEMFDRYPDMRRYE